MRSHKANPAWVPWKVIICPSCGGFWCGWSYGARLQTGEPLWAWDRPEGAKIRRMKDKEMRTLPLCECDPVQDATLPQG